MKKNLVLCALVFALSFFAVSNVEASRTYTRGIVTGTGKVISSSGNQLKSDTGGNISLSKPEAVEVLGEEGTYYRIKFMYSGFIYEGLISKKNLIVKTYTTDDQYEAQLVANGFPQDYARKLAVLHAIHPNWSFTPSFTGRVSGGLDFKTVVDMEARVVDTNLISGSNTSLRSTADGAYKNGEWVQFSGGGWYAASKQTIAFYMDPRNFLDESHIFMFENLGYNPTTQTKETVDKVIGGTFMKNPYECYVDAKNCILGVHSFTDTFMEIGAAKNVSPVHLASRVVQEQGVNGSDLSLGKGYNKEYIGYYNFFNVNANGKTQADVILAGLKYAYDKGWNNQYVSIFDGSSLIANSYIGRGQSTLYYQKFNTIVSPYYSMQYMQNIRAPYSEAYNSTYTSYFSSKATLEEWDNEVYDFLIPIYSNMGEYTTLDASQNADATLKALNITGCELNMDFISSAYNYECYAPVETNEIRINAETTNVNATLTNPGLVKLNEKETTAEVIVEAVNGQRAIYSIKISKLDNDVATPLEILNDVGLKVSGEFVYNISEGEDISNIINSIRGKHFFAKVTLTNPDGSSIKEGVVKTGLSLKVSNNNKEEIFKIVLYGDVNGDGTIDIRDLLGIQKHLVGSKMLDGAYNKASDINKDNVVDIRDLLLVQKQLVGQYTINQG